MLMWQDLLYRNWNIDIIGTENQKNPVWFVIESYILCVLGRWMFLKTRKIVDYTRVAVESAQKVMTF